MAGEKVFHALPAGELHICLAAVAENHDKKRHSSSRDTQGNGARITPIDLSCLARSKSQRQVSRSAWRSHRPHVLFDDAGTAGVSFLAL